MKYDVIVLGAGINGLSTAYHLLRRGVTSLCLLEQFEVGHKQGSSHGKSRITRSTYSSPKYVQLIQVAHGEEWPRLSREAGRELLKPVEGCFFGPGVGPYIDSLKAVPELEDSVEVLSRDRARKAFPHFRFPDSDRVIRDLTCAVVAAEETIVFLSRFIGERAALLENCPVSRIERRTEEIVLHTPRGTYSCERLAVTAGAWVQSLLPDQAATFQVAHQDVGYFEVKNADRLPVWVYCPEEGDHFYGLPSFGRPGAKAARHRTGAEEDDPGRRLPEEMPEAAAKELESFLDQQFSHPAKLIGYEPCLYTNTRSEDYVLDHLPGEPRIVVGAACSGHGFKFGPLTGRLVAELLLDGRSSLELFEEHRASFSWNSQQEWT